MTSGKRGRRIRLEKKVSIFSLVWHVLKRDRLSPPIARCFALNRRSHQVREKVRGTGERRDFERGEGGGVVVIEGGCAFVAEGEERDDLDAAADDVGHSLEDFRGTAGFVGVPDEDEDRSQGFRRRSAEFRRRLRENLELKNSGDAETENAVWCLVGSGGAA